jgi:serine/threonine protein kinase
MSRQLTTEDVSLPLDLRRQMEPVCDTFDRAWREGGRPRLEDFLTRAPEQARPHLLCELLGIELEYRAGEGPTEAEYRQRFPDHAGVIASAWGDTPGAAHPARPGSALTVPGYEIVRELGRGGMGVVYEARQLSLNRRVALKVLGAGLGLTPNAVQRFHREAEAAARLHHTNIVPVYATGEQDGTHFYAMELIDGPSLDAVIRQLREDKRDDTRTELPADMAATGPYVPGNPTPPPSSSGSSGSSSDRFDRAAAMIGNVADALHHAHQQGVIHRDIKPSNLLLSSDGRLSVTDFGLARMLEQPGMTVTGEFVGTPAYTSPEQVTAGRIPVDHRTDIYSLGATLYELLTLRPPFVAEGRDKLLAMVVQKDPPAPRSLEPKVPRDLETICLKCLEKDPDRRYQSGKELADDLRRYLNRFAIRARRAGPLARAGKWVKRNPVVSLFAVALLLALGAAGAFAWRAHEAEHQRLAEEHKREQEALTEKRRAVIERGMTAALAADLATAEKAVADAEVLGASAGEVRLLRGFIDLFNGRTADGIAHMEQAVRLMPQSVSARALLAYALRDSGDWAASWPALDEAVRLPPQTPQDKLFLGLAISVFQSAKGLPLMEAALAERQSAIGHVLRAKALVEVAYQTGTVADAEAAVADAELAKRLLGGNPFPLTVAARARLTAASAYQRARQPEKWDEQMAVAVREADGLSRFPGNFEAVLTRYKVGTFQDGLAGRLDMTADLRQLLLAAPGPGVADFEATNLLCLGRDDEAAAVAGQFPRDRASTFVRTLVALHQPDGRAEARRAWEAYGGRGRPPTDRLEGVPLLFLIGSPAEVTAVARELRAAVDQFRYSAYDAAELAAVLGFLEGTMAEANFLDRPAIAPITRCRRHYLVGWKRLGAGDRAGAEAAFRDAYAVMLADYMYWQTSRAVLIRMKKDPSWPRAIPKK